MFSRKNKSVFIPIHVIHTQTPQRAAFMQFYLDPSYIYRKEYPFCPQIINWFFLSTWSSLKMYNFVSFFAIISLLRLEVFCFLFFYYETRRSVPIYCPRNPRSIQNTNEIYCLTVLGAGILKSGLDQGWFLLRVVREELFRAVPQLLAVYWQSLAFLGL